MLPVMLHAQELRDLVALATPGLCQCALRRCGVWDSMSEADWPAVHMRAVASLRNPHDPEPHFAEYHPHGTRYDSPDAPIAPSHFPANRCDVHQCTHCQRHWLRYTEFGGYYIDHRVRELHKHLLTDAPAD